MTVHDDDQGGCQPRAGGVAGCHLSPDPSLREEGWEWRCNADGAKLKEVVETYLALGLAVRMERLDLSELSDNCAGCKGALAQASAVFVRQKV